MIPLTLAEAAAVTGGRLAGLETLPDGGATLIAGDASADSRTVGPGGLFVALHGEHADGHAFAAAAYERGAVACLCSEPVGGPSIMLEPGERAGRPGEDAHTSAGGGTPGDTAVLDALGALAREVRRRSRALVVGVTGSSGKTTTKDMLAHVLAVAGPTVAAEGSFNNDLGLPLTILRVAPDTAHLVLEMGARSAGHIARLCRIAEPDAGVVLNVGSAHLGEFGSQAAVAAAKQELVEALPVAGLAVLNGDDPRVAAMASATRARVVRTTANAAEGASVAAVDVRLDDDGRAAFRLTIDEAVATVRLRYVGAHMVPDALAVAAVAAETGMSVEQIATALTAAEPRARWRMEVSTSPAGITVVNDAYNANPESVRAALDAVAARAVAGGGRRWAVLGEMRELGETSAALHAGVGAYAAGLGFDRVVAVGAAAEPIAAGAAGTAEWRGTASLVGDVHEALRLLRAGLAAGDVVVVKSSRDSGLRYLGDAIAAGATEVAS